MISKDYFGPNSTRSLYMIDQPHIWESNPGLADNNGNYLQRSGKVWRNRLSPTRVGYRKSDWLLFSNMFKNRADQIMSAQGRLGRPRVL